MRAGLDLAGRYTLQELLGSGGMGDVWRAADRQLDRPVAVKMLRERLADPELAERFQGEARIAARLQHPGITVVHDIGSHDGQFFIVMELLHGRDLAAMLAEAPTGLPANTAVSLVVQAADALEAAHRARVIHRDLKPANLFLLSSGQLKICDFGIARAIDATAHFTDTGLAIGTPAYMSPEQCEGKQVDERSDLYSLGCVLYALLTGQPPFATGEPLAIMFQHLNVTPVNPRGIRPDIPAKLDSLVLNLLAKKPADRPPDASHVVAVLRAIRHEPTVKVDHDPKPSPPARGAGEQPERAAGLLSTIIGPADRAPDIRLPASIPGEPIKVGSYPGSIAITPDGATAYILTGLSTVTPLELTAGTVGIPIKIPDPGDLWAIAITPDGQTAYVTHDLGGVIPIALGSGKCGEMIAVGGKPIALAITPDGATAYVALQWKAILPLRLSSPIGKRGKTIPVGMMPAAIAISPDGTVAYVSSVERMSSGDGVVTAVNLSTAGIGTPVKVGRGPHSIAITPDGKAVYTANANDGTVTPISLATGTAGPPIRVGNHPTGIAVTPDGKAAYVTNWDDGTVTPIRLATGTAGPPIKVGNHPQAVAVTPDGKMAYVVNRKDGTVTPISIG